jgi:sirohydrochlorin cobaltochelatase
MVDNPQSVSNAQPDRGMLIIGHGTEEERGRAAFARLVELVARRAPQAMVEGCFLEFAAPDIAAGFHRLYERGARDVTVTPLLLFAAGHAKRDIPAQIAAAQSRLAGVVVRQAECLNCAASLVELSTARYRAALAPLTEVSSGETLLLFVGRGSKDDDANAEMRRFAQLRGERTPVGRVEICYLAMTGPSLEESLALIATLPFARVIVQPHLLFPGKLTDRIEAHVAAAAAAQPAKEFVLVEPLGADYLLVKALFMRAAAALAKTL